METIQIALVDDHRLFRSGIASLINNFKGFNILFEASNGEEMVRKISTCL
jgi:DNA-binding NarL/FixJ family response regulator